MRATMKKFDPTILLDLIGDPVTQENGLSLYWRYDFPAPDRIIDQPADEDGETPDTLWQDSIVNPKNLEE